MEIFKMNKQSTSEPGKWESVFDTKFAKATKRGTWFDIKKDKPLIKVNGRWVEK